MYLVLIAYSYLHNSLMRTDDNLDNSIFEIFIAEDLAHLKRGWR